MPTARAILKKQRKGSVPVYKHTFAINKRSVPVDKLDPLKSFYRMIGGDQRNTAVFKPKRA